MALWTPVGRNPTGVPKSRALPLDRGGDDTSLRRLVLAQLAQFDVRIDLDVPVAVAAWLDKDVVVDEPGREDPGHQQQVVDLLLAQRDRDADQSDDRWRRPEWHLPRPWQVALRKAAHEGRDADQAVENDQQYCGEGHDRNQATLVREDGRQRANDKRRYPGRAAAWLNLSDPLADHARPCPVAAGCPDDPCELQGDGQTRVQDGDDGADCHDLVEGVTKRALGGVE